MKQWKKSSRWRAAVKREHSNLRNSWRLSCVLAGTNPFRPVSRSYEFLFRLSEALVIDQFAAMKPFPRNAGATTIRFIR